MRFSSLFFKRSPRPSAGQTANKCPHSTPLPGDTLDRNSHHPHRYSQLTAPANRSAYGVILRHPRSSLDASHQALGRGLVKKQLRPGIRQYLCFIFVLLAVAASCTAQQPEGPQADAPPPVPPKPPPAQPTAPTQRITVPAGPRVGVVLQNGISTRSAKPGDSVYLQTSFPITQSNRVVIPVGSYLRGALLESKRPGRVKGRGEFRLRLDTLILPNGYTVS